MTGLLLLGMAVAAISREPYSAYWLGGILFLAGLSTVFMACLLYAWKGPPRSRWYWGAVFVGLIFLLTLHQPAGWGAAVHYLALMATCCLLAWPISQHLGRRWIFWAGVVISVVAAMTWRLFDYGVHEWSNQAEGDEEVTQYFTDYIRRGEYDPYYRELRWTDSNGMHTIKIGFSDSGKKHGRYRHSVMGAKKDSPYAVMEGYQEDLFGFEKEVWYWYDEEISEGEWHLRNR